MFFFKLKLTALCNSTSFLHMWQIFWSNVRLWFVGTMTDAVRGIKGKTGAAPCRTQMLFIDFQNMEGMTAAVHEHCMHIAFAAGYNCNTWEGKKTCHMYLFPWSMKFSSFTLLNAKSCGTLTMRDDDMQSTVNWNTKFSAINVKLTRQTKTALSAWHHIS